MRGDVIDVHPADSEKESVRIELFDEEITSCFVAVTGRPICAR